MLTQAEQATARRQSEQPRVLDLISEKTLGDETDTPVTTWRNLRLRGGGPHYYKLGRMVRYDRREVMEWLATRRRRSTSEASP